MGILLVWRSAVFPPPSICGKRRVKNNNVSGGGKAGAEGVREAVYMHVALAPILLFFFFRFCSAFFLATTAVFVLSSLLGMQRKCFCLRFHSFELMGHRQTNPTLAMKF